MGGTNASVAGLCSDCGNWRHAASVPITITSHSSHIFCFAESTELTFANVSIGLMIWGECATRLAADWGERSLRPEPHNSLDLCADSGLIALNPL
jgi:hypothetical protein